MTAQMKNPIKLGGGDGVSKTSCRPNHSASYRVVDNLLSRLDKVKQTGPQSWIACCPAHDDRSPSLTIRETDDNTGLIHCFGGCSAYEIVSAVGLDISDLFPPRITHHSKPERRPFPAADVLRLMAWESMVVAMTAATMRERALSLPEIDRVIESAAKLNAALSACGLQIRRADHV